jgi:hypothetical protein
MASVPELVKLKYEERWFVELVNAKLQHLVAQLQNARKYFRSGLIVSENLRSLMAFLCDGLNVCQSLKYKVKVPERMDKRNLNLFVEIWCRSLLL